MNDSEPMQTSDPKAGSPARSVAVMRLANVFVHGLAAATLAEQEGGFALSYRTGYEGAPVSLALPLRAEAYRFESFPAFFDGLLPEGWQLEALLRSAKLDRDDLFGQLLSVGEDPVGAVTVVEAELAPAGQPDYQEARNQEART